MKSNFFYLILLLCIMACKDQTNRDNRSIVQYPKTKQVDSVDLYFGTSVRDTYRWLEDDRSEETGAWVKLQNDATY